MGVGGVAAGVGAAAAAASAGNSIFGGSSTPNAGAAGSTQTTNQITPYSALQGPIQTALNSANYLYQGQQPQYYPDSTVAPLNTDQNYSIANLVNTGNNGTPVFDAAQAGLYGDVTGGNVAQTTGAFQGDQSTLGALGSGSLLTYAQPTGNQAIGDISGLLGTSLNPGSNPYLQQAQQNALATALPAVESGFEGGGRMDGGLAASAAAQGATQALGALNYSQYNTNVSNQLGAAGAANTAESTALGNTLNAQGLASSNFNNQTGQQITALGQAPGYDAQTIAGQGAGLTAGNTEQAQQQNVLQGDINRWNYNQQLPFSALSTYEQFLTGAGASNYNTGTSTSPYYQNGLANALSSGLGAYQLANGIGNSSALAGLFGSSTGTLNGTPLTLDQQAQANNSYSALDNTYAGGDTTQYLP